MKRILLSFSILTLVAVVGINATRAILTDEGDVLGNTVNAGSLDVQVDGSDETLENIYTTADLLAPDNSWVNLGTATVSNVGTLDGRLIVRLTRFASDENGLVAPETDAGDSDATQVDTTGYAEVEGDGELGSQVGMRVYIDSNSNGTWQSNETTLWSGEHIDLSSHYSLPLDTDIAEDNNIDVAAGDSINLGFDVRWIDDTSNSWWGGYSGMSNNQAMTDTFEFDVTVGLEQI